MKTYLTIRKKLRMNGRCSANLRKFIKITRWVHFMHPFRARSFRFVREVPERVIEKYKLKSSLKEFYDCYACADPGEKCTWLFISRCVLPEVHDIFVNLGINIEGMIFRIPYTTKDEIEDNENIQKAVDKMDQMEYDEFCSRIPGLRSINVRG